jgi:hypothetical protein
MCVLTDDKPAVVIDPESNEEKSLDLSGPRIRCPKMWLVAAQARPMVLCLRARMEHLRYRGSALPAFTDGLRPPLPQVWRVVAAFGLVYRLTSSFGG